MTRLAPDITPTIESPNSASMNNSAEPKVRMSGRAICTNRVRIIAPTIPPNNEAEKAAEINVVDVRMTGAFGRVYLGGAQRDIDVAAVAAAEAITAVHGRTKETGKER